MDNEYLDRFRESLKAWTDHRFVTADQIEGLAMFHLYLVNLSEDDGWVYAGHSMKIGTPMCCLVVKSWHGDVPMVVFTSAATPMGCIRIFLRKLQEELLEWQRDKYRG